MKKAIVVRTERGLVIEGTRITLYQILEHMRGGWTPDLLAERLGLPLETINEVLSWIHAHRSQVDREDQYVTGQAEKARAFWEARNREKLLSLGKLNVRELKDELAASTINRNLLGIGEAKEASGFFYHGKPGIHG